MNLLKMADFRRDDLTEDDLIGGAVRLLQPKSGYRVSMDTVLLAAAIPAKPGEHVLDAGTGSGGAAMCLARRCERVLVSGIEIQPELTVLARRNAELNGLDGRVRVVEGCITSPSSRFEQEGAFDHVMANPPYLEAGHGLRPPNPSKGIAHMDTSGGLKSWTRFCLSMVRSKGSVTFIYRADRMDELIARLYRRTGEMKILPIVPRQGRPAKRVIIQARKGLHGAATLLSPLAMHGEQERYTPLAEKFFDLGMA